MRAQPRQVTCFVYEGRCVVHGQGCASADLPLEATPIDPSWFTWLREENRRVRRWQRIRRVAKWVAFYALLVSAGVVLALLAVWGMR